MSSRRFGRYELLERIGGNEFADIFRAKSLGAAGFEKVVAVKCILPALANEPEFVRSFSEQANISAGLNHTNVAQALEFGVIDGVPFFAMEHVPGRSLREILRRFAPTGKMMPIPLALHVAHTLCNALSYAHGTGVAPLPQGCVLHLGVAPESVLVSFEGAVKLTDFGLATARAQVSGGKRELSSQLPYAAPEQLAGRPTDPRTDVFAVGAVLYECVVGRPPYSSADGEVVAPRPAELVPPCTANPAIPRQLGEIITRAMAHDADDRYQSASALEHALEQFARQARLSFSAKQLARWMKASFVEASGEGQGATIGGWGQPGGESTGRPPRPPTVGSRPGMSTAPALLRGPTSSSERRTAKPPLSSAASASMLTRGPRDAGSLRATLRGFMAPSARDKRASAAARGAPPRVSADGPADADRLRFPSGGDTRGPSRRANGVMGRAEPLPPRRDTPPIDPITRTRDGGSGKMRTLPEQPPTSPTHYPQSGDRSGSDSGRAFYEPDDAASGEVVTTTLPPPSSPSSRLAGAAADGVAKALARRPSDRTQVVTDDQLEHEADARAWDDGPTILDPDMAPDRDEPPPVVDDEEEPGIALDEDEAIQTRVEPVPPSLLAALSAESSVSGEIPVVASDEVHAVDESQATASPKDELVATLKHDVIADLKDHLVPTSKHGAITDSGDDLAAIAPRTLLRRDTPARQPSTVESDPSREFPMAPVAQQESPAFGDPGMRLGLGDRLGRASAASRALVAAAGRLRGRWVLPVGIAGGLLLAVASGVIAYLLIAQDWESVEPERVTAVPPVDEQHLQPTAKPLAAHDAAASRATGAQVPPAPTVASPDAAPRLETPPAKQAVKPKPSPKPRPKAEPKGGRRPVVKPVAKTPKPRPRKRGPGYLLITSRPSKAKVYLDGRFTGRFTPIRKGFPLTLTAGKHKITLVLDGRKRSYSVTIKPGDTRRLTRTLR